MTKAEHRSIIALFIITPTITTILVFKFASAMDIVLSPCWIGVCCGISLSLLFGIFLGIGKGLKPISKTKEVSK